MVNPYSATLLKTNGEDVESATRKGARKSAKKKKEREKSVAGMKNPYDVD